MAETGKSYRRQASFPIRTEDDVKADIAAQTPFKDKEGAVPLEVYFAIRGFRDQTLRAAMQAYTKVRNATPSDYDEIFRNF